MDIKLKTLILDSLMAQSGNTLTPEVIQAIAAELIPRIVEILSPIQPESQIKG